MPHQTDTKQIPFARVNFSDLEEQEVIDCLRSGWITTGPRVATFEKTFAKYTGCQDAVAVSSGTAALQVALTASQMGKETRIWKLLQLFKHV